MGIQQHYKQEVKLSLG